MTFFNPPIQQDDMSILMLPSGEWVIRPIRNMLLGRRLEVPTHKGLIKTPDERKNPVGGKVEILAVGPKVKDVQVGEIVLIGPYCDLEIDDLVLFQEYDIRVVFVTPKDVYEDPALYHSLEYDRPCRVCGVVFSPKRKIADDYFSYCSQACEYTGETGKQRVNA